MRRKLCATLVAFLHLVPSVTAACSSLTPGGSLTSPFWMGTASLHANAKSPFFPGFKVYRNVKDYGAVGNGIADDTAAINRAISDGGSCGEGCPSSSVRPMLIYFPSGTYRVTAPIVPYYFTSLVGDYNNKPQLVADANFQGVAVIDGDPYIPGAVNPDGTGVNWWTNQNNFFRSVRNFVIRTTNMPANTFGTGIHWQVGQATSLINIDLFVSSAAGTKHQGIFMENGSGGFMSDITIDGGAFGMWVSNQQFTIRRVTITNAVSAIYQLWNWGFTWQDIQIVNCQVGFDINTGGLTLATQSAGSLLIVDSVIEGAGIGVRLSSTQPESLAGSVILNNVQMQATRTANIQDGAGTVERASDTTYALWIQGNVYSGTSHIYNRGVFPGAPARPKALLDPNTKMFYQKSRPQYETYLPSQFLSVVSVGGAKGDGVTDDSTAINNFIAAHAGCGILYFDAGTYLVKKTIFVPAGTIIVGEMFSVIMGGGAAFQNQGSPTPVLRVGNKGDVGAVEISDLVITTTGGSQGAVGVEWNIKGKNPGDAGMWDVHVRLGGAIGTGVQASTCPTSSQNLVACATAFLGFHITNTGSGYFENLWVWNADHDLDDPAQTRINAFSARGILVESASGPVWLIGTASEHHVIYQYAFYNAENVYAGLIQTETPYFQPTPNPPAPFSTSLTYGDPAGARQDAWGLVITSSANIFIYGAGLYSFFQTYGQACVDAVNCQNDIALIDTASSAIYIFQLTTTGVVNMITQLPVLPLALAADNKNGFCSTVSYYESPSVNVPPPYNPSIPPKNCTQPPKIVGYYLGGASTRECLPWAPNATDWATYTHIIYGYVQIGTDGGVSLELDYVFELEGILAMKAQAPDLKVMLGVGGWGFGADPKVFTAVVQNQATQTMFAQTVAELCNYLNVDGVDIEFPICANNLPCFDPFFMALLIGSVKAALGRSYIVSVQLPIDYWATSNAEPALEYMAGYVDWFSLITTYGGSAIVAGDDPNDPTWIQEGLALATLAGVVPSSMFLYGIPFYSRPIGSSSLQSSCLSANGLGKGTYPYYGFDSIVTAYDYDQNDFTDYLVDVDSYIQILSMSDGSTMYADSRWSVAKRVTSMIDNCMGGVTVFSLDQDSQSSALTNGIYGAGGFLPTIDVIYAGLAVANSIDGNGYVKSDAYDSFASALNKQYPWLETRDTFAVLLLGALDIQTQVSNQLHTYLTAPELSADNFTLYQKWTGKAIDFAIANATGAANQYWSCQFTVPGTATNHTIMCPGWIDPNGNVSFPSPSETGEDKIYWTLVDQAGWAGYINETLGLNFSTLLPGATFDVARFLDSCDDGGGGGGGGGCGPGGSGVCKLGTGLGNISSALPSPVSSASSGFSSSASMSASASPKPTSRSLSRRYDDPLDPDPNCHTTWTGLYAINTTAALVNPAIAINSYISSTTDTVALYRDLAVDPTTDLIVITSLLQSTLTAISLGNSSIQSTLVYINATIQDEAEEAKVEAEARRSVASLVESILLGFIGFIPGVGDIIDLVAGGAEIISTIVDILDIADLATSIAEDSRIFRILAELGDEGGLISALDRVEETLSPEALVTRGKFGDSVGKLTDQALQCGGSNFGNLLMNGVDLGSSLAPPVSSTRRRGLDDESARAREAIKSRRRRRFGLSDTPHFNTPPQIKQFDEHLADGHQLHADRSLARRASGTKCIFRSTGPPQLKSSASDYRKHCDALAGATINVPNDFDTPTSFTPISWADCTAKYSNANCQCDHLLEANEVQTFFMTQMSSAEKADLCKLTDVFGTSLEDIKAILNGPKNFYPLWGAGKDEHFNPNSMKKDLLTNLRGDNGIATAWSKYNAAGKNLVYDQALDHILNFADTRADVANDIDAKLHSYYAAVQKSGSATQKAAFAKLYVPNADGTQRPTMKVIAQNNALDAQNAVARLTQADKEPLSTKKNPADPNTSTSAQNKAIPKVPRNGNGDGAGAQSNDGSCGTRGLRSLKRKTPPD